MGHTRKHPPNFVVYCFSEGSFIWDFTVYSPTIIIFLLL